MTNTRVEFDLVLKRPDRQLVTPWRPSRHDGNMLEKNYSIGSALTAFGARNRWLEQGRFLRTFMSPIVLRHRYMISMMPAVRLYLCCVSIIQFLNKLSIGTQHEALPIRNGFGSLTTRTFISERGIIHWQRHRLSTQTCRHSRCRQSSTSLQRHARRH